MIIAVFFHYLCAKYSFMGTYLNPDSGNFARAINAEIYVDKTRMLSVLNDIIKSGNNYICVSRARRFGKTMANNMMVAYYGKGCDSREMFSKFKIAKESSFETYLNKFNVIKIDVNSEYQNTRNKDNLVDELSETIKAEMRQQFPQVNILSEYTLAKSIQVVYEQTGETFVILMDEYDVLIRENVSDELFQSYLGFLNGLFKSDTLRPAIALAYLTGIMPIVRDKVQSKLNNFREYTMLWAGPLAEFTGFTVDEVKSLCDRYGADFNECKQWYDGYVINGIEIYNPQSVVESMLRGRFRNYWNMTSSYEVISDRISQNFDGTKDAVVRMLSGESVDVNVTTFLNTMQSFRSLNDVFTYLIHLGYLAYDEENETCRVPNREVMQEWQNAVSIDSDYNVTNRIISQSKLLLKETFEGNAEAVALALDESHINVASNRSYNSEDVLQSAIYLAYIYALNKYTIVREMTAGKGFADVVYIPVKNDVPAMIVELKRNGCVDSALNQIRERKYFMSLEHYHGDLLFVAINYDEKTKRHECVIDKFEK